MNTLEQIASEFTRLNLTTADGLNFLMNKNMISDNVVFLEDIAEEDALPALAWLKGCEV